MMSNEVRLTAQDLERAIAIFERNCRNLLTTENVIVVDVPSGEYVVGPCGNDGGVLVIEEYLTRYGRGRPNVLFQIGVIPSGPRVIK